MPLSHLAVSLYPFDILGLCSNAVWGGGSRIGQKLMTRNMFTLPYLIFPKFRVFLVKDKTFRLRNRLSTPPHVSSTNSISYSCNFQIYNPDPLINSCYSFLATISPNPTLWRKQTPFIMSTECNERHEIKKKFIYIKYNLLFNKT